MPVEIAKRIVFKKIHTSPKEKELSRVTGRRRDMSYVSSCCDSAEHCVSSVTNIKVNSTCTLQQTFYNSSLYLIGLKRPNHMPSS